MIDFSKYAGSHSLEEAKEIAKKMAADIFEAETAEALADARSKHGDDYAYELRKGTSIDLSLLKKIAYGLAKLPNTKVKLKNKS